MHKKPAPNEVHVIFSRLQASPELIAELWRTLSVDERDRADRFYFETHRSSFVAARGLLRIILGRYLKIEPGHVRFRYGNRGKPAVSDTGDISFNLSHSGDLVVYAVGEGQQLGVDVECIRAPEDMEQIAQRFFCSEEYRELLTVPAHLRAKAFFNCWTRKEAFVKALGDGLSYPLDRFQVTLHPTQPAAFVNIDGCTGGETPWSLHDVAPSDDYAAALVVESRTSNVRLWRFESPLQCANFCRQR